MRGRLTSALALWASLAPQLARADGPAAAPLAARAADADGWWKGRVFLELDARGPGGLRALAGRAAELRGAGVDGVLVAPMKRDAAGAVEDHAALDPRAGGSADWAAFAVAAHQADLAVLVAFEANHVARSHPWFVAAEAGDRLAQDGFVWAEQRPAAAAERWSESAQGGRWYHHAHGPELPDLDLRHRLTRARVRQAAEGWIERGADGLVLSSVRVLFEDEGGARDRPESVAFVRELASALRAQGALTAVDVDDAGFVYLDPAALAFDGARAHALAEARPDEARVEQGERAAPPGTALGVRARDPRTAARALLAGEAVLLAEPLLSAPEVRAALTARRASTALAVGLRTPVEAKGALWAFVRQDGAARVLVAVHAGEAPLAATLDLRGLGLDARALGPGGEPTLAPVVGQVPALLRGGRATATLPPGSLSAWRIEGAAPPTAFVFGRLGAGRAAAAGGAVVDRGLRFGEARGVGFSRDVERTLRCVRGRGKDATLQRCAVPLEGDGRDPLRWHVSVAPGAYEVEVELEGSARLLAEGAPLAPVPRKKHLAGAVFVRDGRLTLEAVDAAAALVEVRLRPARVRAQAPQVDVRPDRVVVRAPGPGVVEWRMNRSGAEPAESSPLVRRGAAWEATLGPWPKGAVTEVAWVIKGADGAFVTAEGGAEVRVVVQ